jgi:hypothetical protein
MYEQVGIGAYNPNITGWFIDPAKWCVEVEDELDENL